jgi:hypothetical protein
VLWVVAEEEEEEEEEAEVAGKVLVFGADFVEGPTVVDEASGASVVLADDTGFSCFKIFSKLLFNSSVELKVYFFS